MDTRRDCSNNAQGRRLRRRAALAGVCVAVVAPVAVGAVPASATGTFLGGLSNVSTVGSTVPANGDVNPYGVAVVPRTTGRLTRGDVLVSNFNASSNLQGTGTTIMEISPGGQARVFARVSVPDRDEGACPGGIGLTTALAVFRSGWVVVGSLPTTDGTPGTAQAGCLLILNSAGHVVGTISGGPINGPWDMTARDDGDHATLFVTNVLNGTVAANGATVHHGTVVRVGIEFAGHDTPEVDSMTVIGSGFAERTDPAALVVGPTGVALGHDGTLFVADTAANRITAIPDAIDRTTDGHTGRTVSTGGMLNNPLGLTVVPGGHIVTVNAGDGNAVETTVGGAQVATKTIDTTGSPPGAGTLFGLAVTPHGDGLYFVDDATNTLNLLN